MFEGLRRVSLSVDPHDLGRAFTEVLHRRGVTVCDESAVGEWGELVKVLEAARRAVVTREWGELEELVGVSRETSGDVVPTRACVALGGRRSTVCGKAVDDDAEGDLCPMHQEEATAIGRDLVALLTRLRWSRG